MRVSVLIPCYNEEATIAACVESCLSQTRPPDQIVVVNDGSSDGTVRVLERLASKITLVSTPKNLGNKSYAQEFGLSYVTGDIVVTTDADTILEPHFIQRIEKHFQDPKVHAVAGYIRSIRYNWLTACRELDYVVGQDIHKRAQNHLNAILVIPGCAGVFRTDTFRTFLKFDHDTITEDLDLTYKLHKNELTLVYDSSAIVFTQDPPNLSSYIRQMRRWIGGGWQNILKHRHTILSRPSHAFEISLIYIEGTVFGALFFILPLINISFFLLFMVGYFVTALLIGIYASLKRKRLDLLLSAVFFPIVLIINSLIFFEQFIKIVVLRQTPHAWFKPERRLLSL